MERKNLRNRAFSFLLAFCLLLTAAPGLGGLFADKALAATVLGSGECGANGGNVKWTLYSDGRFLLSGTGEMDNYGSKSQYVWDPYDPPWKDLRDQIKNVTIENGVTRIGSYAFQNCDALVNITIPSSVESIGTMAISSCDKLTQISLPNGLKRIDDFAFVYNKSTGVITIPKSVTEIGKGIIDDYGLNTQIRVEEGNPRYHAAGNCLIRTADKTLIAICYNSVIPDDGSVTTIGDSTYAGCENIRSVVIPDTVRSVEEYAFGGCRNLTSVVVSGNISRLSDRMFAYCGALTTVVLREGVSVIGDMAFAHCEKLSTITIPKSLNKVGSFAFYYGKSLTDVYYASSKENWDRIDIRESNYYFESANIHYGAQVSKLYTVRYNANGGTGAPAEQTKTQDANLLLSADKPTRSYKISYNANGGSVSAAIKTVQAAFKQWNTKADGTGTAYHPGGTYLANADATLYAVWTAPKAGDLLIPTRSGYTFAGWYTAKTGGTQITKDSAITGNTTLYAHWTAVQKNTFVVTYNANGGTGAPAAQTKTQGANLTLRTNKPTKSVKLTYNANGGKVAAAGKTLSAKFTGWNTKKDGTGTAYSAGGVYKTDANVTLYAQWTNPAAGELASPAQSGCSFTGWYTAASGGKRITKDSVITADTTLYAHWETTSSGGGLADDEIFGFANDNGNFHRDSYYISNADLKLLTDHVRELYAGDPAQAASVINSIQDLRRQKWDGSCYGMAVASILDKQNAIGFNENFAPGAGSLREVGTPINNPEVESAINYYFLSQRIPGVRNYKSFCYEKKNVNWKAGLHRLTDLAQEGNPLLFCYVFSGGGHAIVIKSAQEQDDGSYHLLAYDNRYPNRDVIVEIDRQFSTCVVDGSEQATLIEFTADMSGYDFIDIDGPDNVYTPPQGEPDLPDGGGAGTTSVLTIQSSGTVKVENAAGDTLLIAGGTASGGMDVMRQNFLVASTSAGDTVPCITLTVLNSEAFTFSSTADDLRVSLQSAAIYGSADVNGAKYVVISATDGVYALGDDYTYDLALSVNNEVCDMIAISGEAQTDVSLQMKGQKVIAAGTDPAKGKITVFSNVVDMRDYTYTPGYTSFLIAGSNGDVQILGSSKGNGVYDVNIGAPAAADVRGDVSGDGEVTAEDARLALRAAVGLEKYAKGSKEFNAADASRDGAITAEDARLILRAAVGLERLS